MIELSIVIPVYNSASCIPELYKRIVDALDELISFEVILVNDKSSDNSAAIIKQTCQIDNRFKAIELSENKGQNFAIHTGIYHASGNYIVIMDDDLQHSPYDILTLYKKCTEGFDVCFANFTEKKQPLWKRVGSSVNGLLATMMRKKSMFLYLSPFKIITRELAEKINLRIAKTEYIDALIIASTKNSTQINIAHHQRYAGKGNFNFMKSLALFIQHALAYTINSQKLVRIIGVLAILLGAGIVPFMIFNRSFISLSTAIIAIIGGAIIITIDNLNKKIKSTKTIADYIEPYIEKRLNITQKHKEHATTN